MHAPPFHGDARLMSIRSKHGRTRSTDNEMRLFLSVVRLSAHHSPLMTSRQQSAGIRDGIRTVTLFDASPFPGNRFQKPEITSPKSLSLCDRFP